MRNSKNLKQRKIPSIRECDKTKKQIQQSILQFPKTLFETYTRLKASDQVLFWREFLNKKYDKDELCIVEQPGLGDCLFESLSSYFPKKNHVQMRKQIVEHEKQHYTEWIEFLTHPDTLSQQDVAQNRQYIKHLQKNNIDIHKLTPKERVDIYLQVMGKTGVWGNNLEIQAFSNIHNKNVVILSIEDNYTINIVYPVNTISNQTIFLVYYGNHYETLYVEPRKQSIQQQSKEPTKSQLAISKRCPVGTRRNKITGKCESKQAKQAKTPIKQKLVKVLKNYDMNQLKDYIKKENLLQDDPKHKNKKRLITSNKKETLISKILHYKR